MKKLLVLASVLFMSSAFALEITASNFKSVTAKVLSMKQHKVAVDSSLVWDWKNYLNDQVREETFVESCQYEIPYERYMANEVSMTTFLKKIRRVEISKLSDMEAVVLLEKVNARRNMYYEISSEITYADYYQYDRYVLDFENRLVKKLGF